ncbi:MAG: response regulator [Sterolibacteriaceae bacterium]|nr:response regulator [Candidatus Methylophosphatis haderslevensis]
MKVSPVRSSTPAGAFRGKRVLLVDRHPAVRASMRDLVSTLGVTSIHMAESSQSAKRHVGNQHFDVILCDYLLEDNKDGQQLLEDLRHTRAIALSTIFMIVTGERTYQSVVSVAELAPDDYLIKPFTPEHLAQRLHKALEKKHVFRIAHELVDASKPEQAIGECDQIARGHTRHALDAMRLKAQLLIALERREEAEELYRAILERKAVPWARMGLAWVLFAKGELDAAGAAAAEVIAATPTYLSAYTFLAEVQEAQGDAESAMQALDRATAHSPNNVARLRKLGSLAVGARDLERARRAFDKVLERAGDSDIVSPDDYANAVRVAIQQGSVQDTEKYVQQLRRRFRGKPEGDFAADVLDSLCLARRGQHAAARASLMKALDGAHALGEAVSPALLMDLAQSCALHDMPGSAISLLERLEAGGVALRADMRDLLAQHRGTADAPAGQSARAPVAPVQVVPEAAPDADADGIDRAGEPGGEPVAAPVDPDHFDLDAVPATVRDAVGQSNAAPDDFDAASAAAAALLDLLKQGEAGTGNDLACMRVLLRRMFLTRSRHPATVSLHKEFAALQASAAAAG